MGKLKKLEPRLAKPDRIVGFAERVPSELGNSAPWRKWKKTARWQRLRMQVLIRDGCKCQMPHCGRLIGDTSQLVADHIRPHRGTEVLFWDFDNLQCLCRDCHDKIKQREEQASKHTQGIWY